MEMGVIGTGFELGGRQKDEDREWWRGDGNEIRSE